MRFLFAGALFIVSIPTSWAQAQSKDDPWAAPLNLSHSGIATNPDVVIDSEGRVHVIWKDDREKYVYTRFEGNQWRAPETTRLDELFVLDTLPGFRSEFQIALYTGPNPLFIAGPGEYIFAFWLTPQGRLFTSSVDNPNFHHLAAWHNSGLIASGVASFAAAVDARGEWHLAYVRTVDEPGFPAGIYYTRSRNNGRFWLLPVLRYTSTYLRGLEEGEANISIAAAETQDALNIYIAWDNRPRKQVLLAQSMDGGKNWTEPALVEGPVPDSGSDGPFNIHVGAKQDSVMLVWQSGRPDGACTQIYQSSSNAGTTWSEPHPMLEELSECAHSNEFVARLPNSPEGPLYLLTETQSQTFLTAWNGLRWSQSQEQPVLAGFADPEIFTQVDYGCHRASLLGEGLYIVGCDQGGGGDIWITSRDLSDTSWFSSPVWSQPAPATADNLEMEAVELATTDDGLIHAFFSQHQDPVIYYTSWNGELWSPIIPVLELPDGEAGWPVIAAGPGNELFLIAPNNRGSLYFSRATSGDAAAESHWSTPTRLETAHDGEVGSVDAAWDAAGTIYVAYSVPVNEKRGIYLVQSKDQGTTWSEPLQVFDGAAAGFDLVGAPSLLISANGSLHVLWMEQSIQGDGVSQPISLYYARSDDGGHTFNDVELVVEAPVAWREIVTDGKGNLHLFWQSQNALTTVWDQVSLDGGQTWQYPEGLPNEGGLAAVTRDPAGRLQLVVVGSGSLEHWLWDGGRWQSEASLGLPSSLQPESSVQLLAAAVNKQGNMMVVFAQPTGEGDVAEKTLFYSTRTLEIPQKQTWIQEVPTETLLAPTITPATPTPELSSTPTGTVESESVPSQNQPDHNETNGRVSPFTMAIVPVALLLLGVLGAAILQATRAKDR